MKLSSDDKKHVCVTCGKSFKLKSGLDIHKRIYIGEMKSRSPISSQKSKLDCKMCTPSYT